MRRLLMLAAAALALAGCGGSGGTTTASTHTVVTDPATIPVSFDVYFLRRGKLAAVPRRARTSATPADAAIAALAEGPTAAERGAGLRGALPRRFSFQVSVTHGVASVTLSSPVGRPALAELTYTLTHLPRVHGVEIAGKRYSRADFSRFAP